MGSDVDSLHRFVSDHLSEVVVALALIVLALAAIVWLWARRVSAMRRRLAEAEAAAGTAASAAAAALAVSSLRQPEPEESADPLAAWAAAAPPETARALQPATAARPSAPDAGVARWAVEGAARLAAPSSAEAPAARPELLAAWMDAPRVDQPTTGPATRPTATTGPAPAAGSTPAPSPAPESAPAPAAGPPAASPTSGPVPAPEPAEAAAPAGGAATGSRLLLVEDDVNVAKLYRLLLESRGYAVRHAADGVEGLDAARRERPDLILLDVMMPRMNGITFLQALRDDPALGAVPAVVLSNFREPRLVERAMALGALEYMVKAQTRPEALIGAIPHWLRGERAVDL
jgi:CheY-like chemotaxis protein